MTPVTHGAAENAVHATRKPCDSDAASRFTVSDGAGGHGRVRCAEQWGAGAMAARHGGGLRVVAEPAAGGGAPTFAVYGDWGRLDPAVAAFDPSAGVVRVRSPCPGDGASAEGPAGRSVRAMPFERLFAATDAARLPDLDRLRRLGDALPFREHDDAFDRETDIPVAYTYFGQFVFHDITHFKPPIGTGPTAGLRAAALDLDSVFGVAPSENPHGPGALPLGLTARDPRGCAFAADLPRSASGAPLIADGRNDDNLALAQVHVAMTAFANAVTATVGPSGRAAALAAEHVQAVVLFDYLPRLVDGDVWRDVVANGRALVWPEGAAGGRPFLVPLEFIAACGRFGHSMVKQRYDWNAHHPGAGAPAFWESTFSSTAYPMRRLDWSWVTDWQRLLPPAGDAADGDALPAGQWPLRAAALSSRLAAPLARMPEAAQPPGGPGEPPLSANLATRSLERAHSLRLASGQAAVRQANVVLAAAGRPTLPLLGRDDILAGEGEAARALLAAEGPGGVRLCDDTPMWLYVLKEAEAQHGGRRLGAFGSRIVAETLQAAIAAADPTILGAAGWRPDPRLRPSRPDRYGLRDLVAFAGLTTPLPAVMEAAG